MLRHATCTAAAAALLDMFALCADEDLAAEIACDLQLDPDAARPIAREMRKMRRSKQARSP
jgi:hypothetical protein